jgi:hypothetical protein
VSVPDLVPGRILNEYVYCPWLAYLEWVDQPSDLRHPLLGYRATYHRTLEIQARLFASVLLGELPEYRSLTTK